MACPRSAALALFLALPALLPAADGDLDTSFSEDGKYLQSASTGNDNEAEATAVRGLPDGSMLVGGGMGTSVTSARQFALMKLRPDGVRDGAFANGGIVEIATPQARASLREIFVQADGAIVLAGLDGSSNPSMIFGRVLANGLLDLSFGPSGLRILPDVPVAGGEAHLSAIARSPDGGYFVAGRCENCEPSALFVLRLDPDAEVDTNFADDGWAIFSLDPGQSHGSVSLTVDESGRPVLAGPFWSGSNDLYLVRLTPGGNFDASFGGGDGIVLVNDTPVDYLSDIQIDPVSGRILLSTGSSILARTSTGAVDDGFGTGGVVDLDLEEGTFLSDLILQSDRKLVAVGRIDHTGPDLGGFLLARFLTNGGMDNSFDGNGVVRYEFNLVPDEFDAAYAVALVGGRVVAAGVAESPEDIFRRSAMAILRTQSTLVFTDGFERGSASGWLEN